MFHRKSSLGKKTHGKLSCLESDDSYERAGSGEDSDLPEEGNCDLWLNVKVVKVIIYFDTCIC